MVWLGVALLLLGRMAVQHLRALRLAKTSTPWPEEGPDVRLSGETTMPLVCGIVNPAIVLPAEAAEWPPERLRLALLHERSHVARLDTLTVFLARFACALYWFNPLVWYALARLRDECERACDDAVLLTGEEAPVYIGHLVEIARSVHIEKPVPEGGIAMARMSQLEHRLRAMLNPALNRAAAGRRALVTMSIAACFTLLPLAGLQPPASENGPGLSGTVRDVSGAVVPAAKVKVTNAANDRVESTRTAADGTFRIAPLEAGLWTLAVSKEGFAELRMANLHVGAAGMAPLNLTMAPGGVNVAVTVAEQGIPKVEAVPTAAGAPKRIKVGGSSQAAKLVQREAPKYPMTCKAEGVEGSVMLRTVISTAGLPLSITPLNKLVDQRLVDAAKLAVEQWRWEPTLLNGQAVEVIADIEINFTLKK
jgi:hypothetical protein